MNIAYVTRFDSIDIKNWSGTEYFIARSLEKSGASLSCIAGLKDQIDIWTRIKNKYAKLEHQKYLVNRSPYVVKGYADQIVKALPKSVDILFSPGTIPIASLETHLPKVFYTDATFASMLGYYDWFDNVSPISIKEAMQMEQMAIDTSALAIYSSEWAAQSAIDNYNADPSKVKVVPFGANIQYEYSYDEILSLIDSRSQKICKILFLGVEWDRKGGETVLKTVEELNNRGINTQLHIIGLKDNPTNKEYPWLFNHGFINKSDPVKSKEFRELVSGCHLLFLPSKADCTPIVFSEVNSMGIPVISTRTGGIPSIIQDNVNGMTFDVDSEISQYADYIYDVFTNTDLYRELSKSSYNEYKIRLNWDVAGRSLISLMKELL